MRNAKLFPQACLVLFLWLPVAGVLAQGYQNGNRLALDYSRANAAERRNMRKELSRVAHTFRYLEIKKIEMDNPEAPRRIVLLTVEPSSDMEVKMIFTQRNSLRLAQTLEVGDCVAADGRIADLGEKTENRMILQPARLNYKDRDRPKRGPELLREVDKEAN